MIKYVLIAILSLLAFPIYNFVQKSNVLKMFEVLNRDTCKVYKPVANKKYQCEDLAKVDDKTILTLCGDFEHRKNWYPPKGIKESYKDLVASSNEKIESSDKFFLFDVDTKRFTELKSTEPVFVSHGFKYRKVDESHGQVLAINHHFNGSVLELYSVDLKGKSVNLDRRIVDPLISTPNGVEFYSYDDQPQGFFVTNDHKFAHGPLRKAEEYLQLPISNVVYCALVDGENTHKCSIVIDGLQYANGIALWKDKLYVACTIGMGLRSYIVSSRGGQVSLRPSTIIPLDFLPDNIVVADNRMFVGGLPKVISFLASVQTTNPLYSNLRKFGFISEHCWSKVVEMKLDEEEWYMGERLKATPLLVDDGTVVSGSSGGLVLNSKLYITMIIGNGIAECSAA